jgi:hypothetical protein
VIPNEEYFETWKPVFLAVTKKVIEGKPLDKAEQAVWRILGGENVSQMEQTLADEYVASFGKPERSVPRVKPALDRLVDSAMRSITETTER